MSTPELLQAYKHFVGSKGRRPHSFIELQQSLSGTVTDIVIEGTSWRGALEEEIYSNAAREVVEVITQHPEWESHQSHECILTLTFTTIEKLRGMRSFIDVVSPRYGLLPCHKKMFYCLKKEYEPLVRSVLSKARVEGILPTRLNFEGVSLVLSTIRFCISFWRSDDSRDFERTDACIEKSIELLFDTLGRNILDSGFDLSRFLLGKTFLARSL
jgi:Tetracyclin repressor-like, C-terminal domain